VPEKLTVVAKPRAEIFLVSRYRIGDENTTLIEHYTTRFGYDYERHEEPGGAVTWYRVKNV
jgi:hypothetical protein